MVLHPHMPPGEGDIGGSWRSRSKVVSTESPTYQRKSPWNPVFLLYQPPLHPLACPQGLKRTRHSESSVSDEEEILPKKRRRLRLGLVTSMLSRPYAMPRTRIPARKASRNGVWARQRIEGRDLLRKAAIFNRIASRRRTCGTHIVELRKLKRHVACAE